MSRKILLTGATGALGPHLAAELLAAGCDCIYVLVRPGAVAAEERFDRWTCLVARLAGTSAHGTSAFRLVIGDISQNNMGLTDDQADRLAKETDLIVHAAADTRFRGPAADQRLVNVEGTRHLLDWAGRCRRLRRFVLVSTTCVAGSSIGSIAEALNTPPEFVNNYERTKWEAERLALAYDLPVHIARVSIIMGSHATGQVHRLGAFHHALKWFGRGLIPLVPGTLDSAVDLIPVETAARCIARAATVAGAPPMICHIAAGRRAVPLLQLMEFVWEHSRSRHDLPVSQWTDRPSLADATSFQAHRQTARPQHDPVARRLGKSIDSFLPGLLLYPKVFQTSAAESLWGGPLPIPDWRQTLSRVLRTIGATATPLTQAPSQVA